MKVILSKHAGFCFGVKRAVSLLEDEIQKGEKRIYTLGHIIHNEDFNESLEKRGVSNISVEDLDTLSPSESLVFVRTHGVPWEVVQSLEEKGIPYVDATCPFVKKIHHIVVEEEKKAVAEEACKPAKKSVFTDESSNFADKAFRFG